METIVIFFIFSLIVPYVRTKHYWKLGLLWFLVVSSIYYVLYDAGLNIIGPAPARMSLYYAIEGVLAIPFFYLLDEVKNRNAVVWLFFITLIGSMLIPSVGWLLATGQVPCTTDDVLISCN